MVEQKPTFDAVMKQIAGNRRETEHPDDETLTTYIVGGLAEPEADHLRSHLADCPRCTRIILDLGTVPDDVPPEEMVSPETLAKGRSELFTRIHRDRGTAPTPITTIPLARYRMMQIAALLLLATSLGLGRLVFLGQEQSAQSQPTPNIQIEDRRAETDQSRSTNPGDTKLSWPADQNMVLVLNTPSHDPYSHYRIAIYREDDTLIWKNDNFKVSPFGNFTLQIPASFLNPGVYHLKLYGLDDTGAEWLATYFDHEVTSPKGN